MANEESLEKTFILVFPTLVKMSLMGELVSDFERFGLTIIGMKFSSVDKNFAWKHFKRPQRIPSKETMIPRDEDGKFHRDRKFWVHYLSQAPVVALLLEGKNAVNQAYEYSLTERTNRFGHSIFQISGGFYSSPTVEIAMEDAEFWFPDNDCGKWSDHYKKKLMVFVFRKSLHGQLKAFGLENSDMGDEYWRSYYYEDTLRVVLIKPFAFQVGRVGDIIAAIEINARSLKGLKLVSLNDLSRSFPQYADYVGSPSSSSFCAAMVVDSLKTDRISVTKYGVDHFKFNRETHELEVDRKLVYISKPGESAWDLIDNLFHFGFVILPRPNQLPILEASMTGL